MKGIYKITSPSGHVYIGQSVDIKRRKRFYRHWGKSFKKTKLNHSFYHHGGFDTHKFEVIHELPEDVDNAILDEYERVYLSQYKALGLVILNSREAGRDGKHLPETKAKCTGRPREIRFAKMNAKKRA